MGSTKFLFLFGWQKKIAPILKKKFWHVSDDPKEKKD